MVVYITGSHQIVNLDAAIKQKLDSIMAKHGKIILGDCYGLDLAIQNYLCSKGYKDVAVFYPNTAPCYNVGGWPEVRISGYSRTDKQKAMTQFATVCFAIWDGKSRGTARHIARARYMGRDVVVIQPDKKPYMLKGARDCYAPAIRGRETGE